MHPFQIPPSHVASTLPRFNRETCTEAEWRAFFLANYLTVLAYQTARRALPPGIWRVNCPICQESYVTTDNEQSPMCPDCPYNARDIARECEAARTAVYARRQREDHLAWSSCIAGDCEHDFGWEGCYLAIQRRKHGPGY